MQSFSQGQEGEFLTEAPATQLGGRGDRGDKPGPVPEKPLGASLLTEAGDRDISLPLCLLSVLSVGDASLSAWLGEARSRTTPLLTFCNGFVTLQAFRAQAILVGVRVVHGGNVGAGPVEVTNPMCMQKLVKAIQSDGELAESCL